MPRNCSRDFERIVNYVDGLITAGNVTEISKIKVAFGLQGLPHDDDFMGYVTNLTKSQARQATAMTLIISSGLLRIRWENGRALSYTQTTVRFSACATLWKASGWFPPTDQ